MPPSLRTMIQRACALVFVAALPAVAAPRYLVAQRADSAWEAAPPLVMIGGDADDRLRVLDLLGRGGSGSLIRSPLTLSPDSLPRTAAFGVRWASLGPVLSTAWNSAIPVSMNDGAMWAGRGWNFDLTGGMRVQWRRLTVVAAPEVTASQNLGFPNIASADKSRSTFASPWHELPESADLPLRFGDQSFVRFSGGQSAIEVDGGAVAAGATTENQWWGPAIRNPLVMSNNAPGIPQLYLRTRRPLATRLGTFEARWMIGALTDSRYFELDSAAPRSLSALVATLRTALDTGLTVGLARAVYAQATTGSILSHAADVLTRWNQTADTLAIPSPPTDQIASVFFDWKFAESGVEAYGEWARLVPPRSLHELIVNPQTHEGYTAGLQWANALRAGRILRVQAEVSSLVQTPEQDRSATLTFYTSHVVPAGYTQEGQVIGAATGPGSTSQFLGADLMAPRWRLGVELGRIRWEDEAYYRQPTGLFYRNHDVSLFSGLRGAATAGPVNVAGEVVFTRRNNFLFQTNDTGNYTSAFDMHDVMLRLTVTPLRF